MMKRYVRSIATCNIYEVVDEKHGFIGLRRSWNKSEPIWWVSSDVGGWFVKYCYPWS